MDSIEAVRRAAFSSALPWGNSSIFSPGLMPRCFNTSLRKVTCPRAVTVRMAINIFYPPSLLAKLGATRARTQRMPRGNSGYR
jgi:hypothetical protein